MIHLASQTALSWWWLWHPLFGPGYQFYSGVGSDLQELALPATIIVAVLTVRRFLHSHFECHEETCHKLGVHRVEGTAHRTCWHHHPVLSQHAKHGVPLAVIHDRHRAANG